MNKTLILMAAAVLTAGAAIAQWPELGGNNSLQANNNINAVAIDKEGNIYTGGQFTNSAGKHYVAKNSAFWQTWSELGGGNSLKANGDINALAADKQNNIYAAGSFTNNSGRPYVAKKNAWGNSWSELGGANTLMLGQSFGFIATLTTDKDGNVYAAGQISNSSDNYYVAKWNACNNTWSELGGANSLSNLTTWFLGPVSAIVTDKDGNVYVGGDFSGLDANGNFYSFVAKWNACTNTWSELGGVNSFGVSGGVQALAIDKAGNVYAGGSFTNGSNPYVAKWDANTNTWAELGGANSLQVSNTIFALTTDKNGNVYAGGDFYGLDNNGNFNAYVSRWDAATNAWSNLSVTTGGIGTVLSLVAGNGGKVYAGGRFYNNANNRYVAVYKPAYQFASGSQETGLNIVAEQLGFSAYPNPVSNLLYLHTDKSHPALSVSVVNIAGHVVSRQELSADAMMNNETALDMSGLSNGLYIVTISGQDINHSFKVTKK